MSNILLISKSSEYITLINDDLESIQISVQCAPSMLNIRDKTKISIITMELELLFLGMLCRVLMPKIEAASIK